MNNLVEEVKEEIYFDLDKKSINDWCKIVNNLAREKGWWSIERSPLEIHALIHSEISEATEEVRNNKVSYYIDDKGKPQGEEIELADCVIRIMDYFVSRGWNLEEAIKIKHNYNKTREFRHGSKKY